MRRRSIAQVIAVVAVCAVCAGAVGSAVVRPASGAPLTSGAARPTATPSTGAAIAAVTPMPAPGMKVTPAATASGPWPITNVEALPACTIGDTITPMSQPSDWALTLVDSYYDIPKSYAPDDLVLTSEAGLSSYFSVRSIMIGALRGMAIDARSAGAPLGIASAYRDYSEQIWTFWYWVAQLGYDRATKSSARPGHSEHQLGLTIDFSSLYGPDPWTYRDFARETTAGAWLAANAWRYGFLMSYPSGKVAKTCYDYEPWHYRYVGAVEAAAVHASGLTLREWLWRRQPNPEGLSPMSSPQPAGTVAPMAPDSSATLPPTPAEDWPAP